MKLDVSNVNKSGIYCIINKVNNKKYIGSSINLYHRIASHNSYLSNNNHKNPILQNSYNKYGEVNFEAFVVEYCNECDLIEREEYYIKLFGDFNCATFENTRIVYSDETRERISRSRIKGFIDGSIRKYQEKPVLQYDLEGLLLNEYRSISEACQVAGIGRTSLKSCLNGTYSQMNGFQWKFKSSDEEVGKYIKAKRKLESLNRMVAMIDMNSKKLLIFYSVGDCANHFNVKSPSISQFINKSKSKIYRRRYKLLF